METGLRKSEGRQSVSVYKRVRHSDEAATNSRLGQHYGRATRKQPKQRTWTAWTEGAGLQKRERKVSRTPLAAHTCVRQLCCEPGCCAGKVSPHGSMWSRTYDLDCTESSIWFSPIILCLTSFLPYFWHKYRDCVLQMEIGLEKQWHQHNESPAMADTVGPSDSISAPLARLFIMRTRQVLSLLFSLFCSLPPPFLALSLALSRVMRSENQPNPLPLQLAEVWLSMKMTSSREKKMKGAKEKKSARERRRAQCSVIAM